MKCLNLPSLLPSPSLMHSAQPLTVKRLWVPLVEAPHVKEGGGMGHLRQ